MIYSKTCEYAIRALIFLAFSKTRRAQIVEISKGTGVPKAYIAKIFQSLVKQEILNSQRGPSGGFSFSKDPSRLSLLEIIESIDDAGEFENDCVMGLDECSSKNACPLHRVWAEAKENILKKLSACMLTDVGKKIGKKDFRNLKRSKLVLPFSFKAA